MNQCNKCNREFKTKYLLSRHEKNKLPCDTGKKLQNIYDDKIKLINNSILQQEELIKIFDDKINIIETELSTKDNTSFIKHTCIYCKKKYSTKQNTQRHIYDNCEQRKIVLNDKLKLVNDKNISNEEKNKLIMEKNDIIENKNKKDKDNEIQELKKMFKQMLEKQSIQPQQIQNIINNNNNITNNIQNNLIVNINSFGKETIDHITLQDYKKYLNGFFKGFLNFIEKIHFDDNAPENHNLCITNMKSKFMYVYENDDWILKEKNDIIDNLVTNKFNLLTNKYEELEESRQINNKTIDNFEEFQQNYENKEAHKNIKKDVSLMVYNNKEKVKKKLKIK